MSTDLDAHAPGIPAALHQEGTVHSRCEQTLEPLHLEVGLTEPFWDPQGDRFE